MSTAPSILLPDLPSAEPLSEAVLFAFDDCAFPFREHVQVHLIPGEDPTLVLPPGPPGSHDEQVRYYGTVIRLGDTFHFMSLSQVTASSPHGSSRAALWGSARRSCRARAWRTSASVRSTGIPSGPVRRGAACVWSRGRGIAWECSNPSGRVGVAAGVQCQRYVRYPAPSRFLVVARRASMPTPMVWGNTANCASACSTAASAPCPAIVARTPPSLPKMASASLSAGVAETSSCPHMVSCAWPSISRASVPRMVA